MNAVPDDDDPPMTLKAWYAYLWRRRTTALGYVLMGLAGLAEAGHLPAWACAILLGAGGGSVAGVGHYNNALLKRQSEKVNP